MVSYPRMKRFLRRFVARLAFVAALVPCVPAFGEAVETVAYWNRDFSTATKGGYTVTLGEGATLNPDGTVTLTQEAGKTKPATHGVEINFYDETGATAFEGTEMTVLVKYSGLSITDSRFPLLATIWGDNKDAAEFVLSVKNQNRMYYADGITAATTSVSDKEMGSVTQTLPTEGYMLVSMSGYQDGNAGCKGTRIGFAPLNEDGSCGDFIDYGYQSAATHTDQGFYGIKVGGTIGPIQHFYRPGMKVEQVAIIKGFATTMKTFRYLFPNECTHFDYAGQNPTTETKYLDVLSLRQITNAVFSAKVMAGSMNWVGGMVCACQKAFSPAEGDPTKMAIQYQVHNSDWDKSADIDFTDKADGVYFKKTGGHYNAASEDKLGTDDATWAHQSGNYNFNDFSIYVPHVIEVASSKNWSQLTWPWGGKPTGSDVLWLNVTASPTVTIDAASAVSALYIVSNPNKKLTLKYTSLSKLLSASRFDFSRADGKVAFDCLTLTVSGTTVLMSGTILGTANIDVAGSKLPSGASLIVTDTEIKLTVAQWTRGAGTDVITDANNWKGGYVPYADGAFTDDFSLAADADWSAVTISAMNGKVIDLNGHRLTLSSLTGTGMITDSSADQANPGAFVASVASGKTLENTGVALSGNLKFVKEGAGTFIGKVTNQNYTGGTVVNAGTIKSIGYELNFYYGADATPFTINADGILDINGQYSWYRHHIYLNGGTIRNDGNSQTTTSNRGLGNITLLADSFIKAKYHIMFNDTDPAALNLGGYTLKVSYVENSDPKAILYFNNTTITNGTLEAGSHVVFYPMKATTLGTGASVVMNGDIRFGSHDITAVDFIDNSLGSHETLNNHRVHVTGRYTPQSKYLVNATLKDGATLDLVGQTGTWEFTCKSGANQSLAFDENAAIVVDLTGRKDLADGMKVVSWTDATKPPESVTFKGVGLFGSLVRKTDGVYVDRGIITIFR